MFFLQKRKTIVKSDFVYKLVWNTMLISVILATLLTGIMTMGFIPNEWMGIYLLFTFICIVIAAISAIFYYIIRVLKTEKKEKKIVYYKRGNK